eukprot:CAMPEP_0116566518 /NCGR_PEP_ID=MMETSP0397-20121206/14504_1 /TAXON_ID=216820 /ORGANISM="Cyclophora tenuis, Strain ECT3854" /LENGTH=149 /DNA_ID=CAMNT_0004093423 /DNA_START=256 /DNA_END=702 /DNA_ORIENTATION=-
MAHPNRDNGDNDTQNARDIQPDSDNDGEYAEARLRALCIRILFPTTHLESSTLDDIWRTDVVDVATIVAATTTTTGPQLAESSRSTFGAAQLVSHAHVLDSLRHIDPRLMEDNLRAVVQAMVSPPRNSGDRGAPAPAQNHSDGVVRGHD